MAAVTRRPPDDQLRSLLAEASWTGQELARAVNALGAETGMILTYDRTSVAHWLRGTRPRPPVPALISEVFTRRLGRIVAYPAHDISDTRRTTPSPTSTHAVSEAAGWNGVDAVSRLAGLNTGPCLLHGGVYSLAALAVPEWEHATTLVSGHEIGAERIGYDQ